MTNCIFLMNCLRTLSTEKQEFLTLVSASASHDVISDLSSPSYHNQNVNIKKYCLCTYIYFFICVKASKDMGKPRHISILPTRPISCPG